jgi:serine phosphatase RsbU (regulator of sigma subunit)
MSKNLRIYLYTFFGVGLGIFLIGFVGIDISLKYIQNKYIQLQIDVNKRQAEQMSGFIESQLKEGVSMDSIRNQFQKAIAGTEMDKGFLCMYDVKEDHLVCHPDKNAIGKKFTKDFIFQNTSDGTKNLITDIYKQNKGVGGIFVQANLRTDIIYTIPINGTDWFVNAHENINAISSEIRMLRNRYIWGSLILGLLIAISATVTARKISRRYEKEIEWKNEELDKNYKELKILNEQVNEQKFEIEQQRDFVIRQRDEISQINKQITDSINYAQQIQSAVLPPVTILNKHVPDNFILYKPKDIVSGDFYWFTSVEKYIAIVAADCTGHGVPGAFMSMLGVTLLNEIINNRKILQADLVLNELRNQIKIALGQTGNSGEQKDGMDISLIILNTESLQMQYSGAYNSLYLLRKPDNHPDLQFQEIKADHMPIGVHPKDNIPFTLHQIQLTRNDRIYLFSDGFVSQFGGTNNEKFKSKRFQDLLLSVQGTGIKNQNIILDKALIDWQGEAQQVDDILVIGFQV